MGIEVSVIVPTLGRAGLLGRCLAALSEQDFDKSRYEVIVADDGESAQTRRAVEEHADRMDIMYVEVNGRHGPAAARNAGLRISRGKIIAFTDDDCIPSPGWLTAGAAAFADGVAGAAGKIVVPVPARPTDYEMNASRLAHARFVTANSFYRKAVLVAAGGFDEDFTSAWREDSELHFRLLAGGRVSYRRRSAVVVHPVRPAQWGVSISQQRKNMFNALLYKKHPALYRTHIRPVHPWHYYAIVLALIVSAACAVTGLISAAIGAGIAWLFGTLRFCSQRLRGVSHSPLHVLEMAVTSIIIPPVCIFWRLAGAVRYRVFFL